MATTEQTSTKIPPELLDSVSLHLVPVCAACGDKQSTTSLKICSSCKLVHYCSVDCQRQDWKEHKSICKETKILRKTYEKAERVTANLSVRVVFQMIMMDFNIPATDILALTNIQHNVGKPILGGAMNGFLGLDPLTHGYVRARIHLAHHLLWQARIVKSVKLWEEVLMHLVELKKLTYFWKPYLVDKEILMVLLKLHRDDDAAAFFIDWCERKNHCLAIDSETRTQVPWPFVARENARLSDVLETYCASRMNRIQIESSIDEPSYTVPGSLTMTGEELLHFDCIGLMILPLLFLKSRVLTVLRRRLSEKAATDASSDGDDDDQRTYQQQLEYTQKILECLGEPSVGWITDGMIKLLENEKSKDHAQAARPKSDARLFASLFAADEGPVVDTMVELMRDYQSNRNKKNINERDGADDGNKSNNDGISRDRIDRTTDTQEQKYLTSVNNCMSFPLNPLVAIYSTTYVPSSVRISSMTCSTVSLRCCIASRCASSSRLTRWR